VTAAQFSLLSRGDRVRGRVAGHLAGEARPLVIVCGPDGAASGELVDTCLVGWSGWAVVASIDLPLCGARRSEKLSEDAFDPTSSLSARLARDIRRQVASDLDSARAWLIAHVSIDRERLAVAGFGLGSRLVRSYCERSRDLAAHVLAESESPSESAERAADSRPSDRRAPTAYWTARRGGRREKVAKMRCDRRSQ
jgi:hypothetical protein